VNVVDAHMAAQSEVLSSASSHDVIDDRQVDNIAWKTQ